MEIDSLHGVEVKTENFDEIEIGKTEVDFTEYCDALDNDNCALEVETNNKTALESSTMADKIKKNCISVEQKLALVNLMEAHPELRSKKFRYTRFCKEAQIVWQNISTKLNAIEGSTKDWKQWRKTWHKINRQRMVHARTTGCESPSGGDVDSEEERAMIHPPPIPSAVESAVPMFIKEDFCPMVITPETPKIIENVQSTSDAKKNIGTPTKSRRTRAQTKMRGAVSAVSKLAEQNAETFEIKRAYYEEKLQLMKEYIVEKRRFAAALEKIADALHGVKQRKMEPRRMCLRTRPKVSKTHVCPKCGKQYVFLNKLQFHMLERHAEKPPDKEAEKKNLRKCKYCPLSFPDAIKLRAHVRAAHPEVLFHCTECDKTFFTDKDVFDHKRRTNCGDGQYPCTMCPKAFSFLSELETHAQLAHPNQSHRCEECGVSFGSAVFLRRHAKRHVRSAKHICETCGKAFMQVSVLLVHIEQLHAVEKQTYECKVCGKTYKVLNSFNVHMKLHSEEPGEFECAVCKKNFKLKYHYNRHVHRHIKPYSCDMCDIRFKTNSQLVKHKVWHAREASKPYGCDHCSKRFSTTAAVSFHTTTMHDAKKHIKCDVCGREYYNRFHFAAHYSSHTGIKPYNCDTCGKGYNYNQDFLIHKKRCAPQQNEEDEATSTSTS